MDWFLYDISLRRERVKCDINYLKSGELFYGTELVFHQQNQRSKKRSLPRRYLLVQQWNYQDNV